jgi:hypothetical protein
LSISPGADHQLDWTSAHAAQCYCIIRSMMEGCKFVDDGPPNGCINVFVGVLAFFMYCDQFALFSVLSSQVEFVAFSRILMTVGRLCPFEIN